LKHFRVVRNCDLLNLQLIPNFLLYERLTILQPLPSHQTNNVKPSCDFSFGSSGLDDFDDSFSDDEEEEKKEEGPLFESNFMQSFERPFFETGNSHLVSFKEGFVVPRLATLFTEDYDPEIVQPLCEIATAMLERGKVTAILSAIIYTLACSFSRRSFLISLFSRPMNVNALKRMTFSGFSVPVEKPNILKNENATESDRRLALFMSLHEVGRLITDQRGDRCLALLTGFFHHRHRLQFDKLIGYTFSQRTFEREMRALLFSAVDFSEQMSEIPQNRKWQMTLTNPFISPFYLDHKFRFTCSLEIKTGGDGPVTGVCINPRNNEEIAIVAGTVQVFDVKDFLPIDRDLDRVLGDRSSSSETFNCHDKPFDSPFIDFSPKTIVSTKSHRKMRDFAKWQSDPASSKWLRLLCIAAHPTDSFFVTGEASGKMRLWKFERRLLSESSVQCVNSPICQVAFNAAGDRLLMTTQSGYVLTSDSASAILISAAPGSAAVWLNSDTQIIVCEPRYKKLDIYDLAAGPGPVASFKLKKFAARPTLAAFGSHVLSGADDGSVEVLDLIAGRGQSIQLHKSPVAALSYDASGRFFMSGVAENNVKIVNAKMDAEVEETARLFSDYNTEAANRGTLAFATAKQTIAAAGYSGNVRVWNVSDPRSLLV
jgi:WD40 repeat protein